MYEAIIVQEINSRNGLNKKIESLIFRKLTFFVFISYQKEQVTLLNILKN